MNPKGLNLIYTVTRFFLRVLFRALFSFRIYGLENLPRSGSFIIAANHASHLDPCAIGAFISRKLNYIAKQELFENKFFGWYLRHLRVIAVNRNMPARGMKDVLRVIKLGIPIVVFPEGTRSDGVNFLEPETGVAYLAIKYNLKVVPAYIDGTWKALPKGKKRIYRHPVKLYYGKPIAYQMPKDLDKDEAYMQISRNIMDEIKALRKKHAD